MKHCKIKVSWLWIPFLLYCPFSSLLKTIMFIFLFLSVHEAAHIIMALWFHYPIQKVIIYPFGLCAVINSIGFRSGLQDFMILCAGPMTHVIQPFLISFLQYKQIISPIYADYLNLLNASILLFNMLPIHPLDGGRIMELILQYCFPYTTALQITYVISICFTFVLLYNHILTGFTGFAVCILLMAENIIAMKQIQYKKLTFYRYRLKHPIHYRMRMNTHHDLYRFSYNMMYHQACWAKEEVWLGMYFHDYKSLL